MVEHDSARGETASAILDVAEHLVQTRGFNAFSYADVAAELGITKPALHYHFSSKADLGEALVARYTTRFSEALGDIDAAGGDGAEKLRAYVELYADVLVQDRMCLCGMLAADYDTIPPPMRQAVIRFFDHNETWLSAVIEQGRDDGTVQPGGLAREVAQTIVDTLEGAMLVARTYRDPSRFATSARRLLNEVTVDGTAP